MMVGVQLYEFLEFIRTNILYKYGKISLRHKNKYNKTAKLKTLSTKIAYCSIFFSYKNFFFKKKIPIVGELFSKNILDNNVTSNKNDLNALISSIPQKFFLIKTYQTLTQHKPQWHLTSPPSLNLLLKLAGTSSPTNSAYAQSARLKNEFFFWKTTNLYKFMGNSINPYIGVYPTTTFAEIFFKKNFFFKKRYSAFLTKRQTFLQYPLSYKHGGTGWKNYINTLKTQTIAAFDNKNSYKRQFNEYLQPRDIDLDKSLLHNSILIIQPRSKLIPVLSKLVYPDPTVLCGYGSNTLPVIPTKKLFSKKSLAGLNTTCILKKSLTFKGGLLAPKNNLNPLKIKTISGQNFIFKNIGIFLINNLTNPIHIQPDLVKFKVKKKLFSFIFPNEIKNNFLKLKKSITLYSILYKIGHTYTKNANLPYTVNSLMDLNIRFFKNSEIINLFFKNGMSNFFTTKKIPTYTNTINYLNNSKTLNVLESLGKNNSDNSFRNTEVRISRVRFRPGYQRLWRQARHALKESLNLNFTYQQQLTRHLTKFFKWTNLYSFSKNELALSKVAVHSQLIPDMETFNLFIINKLLYINGAYTFNKNFILTPGDSIQIVISKWYYIYYRWLSNWKYLRVRKFKRLIFRKSLASKYKIIKLRKQKSFYTPDWVFLVKYDISDIKPFIEMDFFTLSAYVIYDPSTSSFSPPEDIITYRTNTFRLYNWKYIT